jgi:hypothetical protein
MRVRLRDCLSADGEIVYGRPKSSQALIHQLRTSTVSFVIVGGGGRHVPDRRRGVGGKGGRGVVRLGRAANDTVRPVL